MGVFIRSGVADGRWLADVVRRRSRKTLDRSSAGRSYIPQLRLLTCLPGHERNRSFVRRSPQRSEDTRLEAGRSPALI